MSKAILVIDMPRHCSECPVCEVWEAIPSLEEYYCNIEKKEVMDRYKKPDWCPLKPVPKKIDISDFDDIVKAESDNAYEVGLCMYNRGIYRGYNGCIDRILGD